MSSLPQIPIREINVTSDIAPAVRAGLTATSKRLPPWLFYDAVGSALFEQITDLGEYYLTRTERSILERYALEMLRMAGPPLTIIELGAGTATKTSTLLRALLRLQLRALYYPIDVSESALRIAVERLNGDLPRLEVRPLVADYSSALAQLRSHRGRKLVLFIGSSIGNYEPREAGELMAMVRQSLRPGDGLLLGTDFSPAHAKSQKVLEAAYDDARGVTAEFNRNMLARINRELGGHFDLASFRHVAQWNPQASRMEMYLESQREQHVGIDALGLIVHFTAGERIHTENSYKFTGAMTENLFAVGGFHRECSWLDERGWYGVHLARAR